MKNKLNLTLIFFLLFSFISLTAQVSSGEVSYKQKIIENLFDSIAIKKIDTKFRSQLDFVNKSLRTHSDNFEFILKFNRAESIYKLVKKMNNDKDRGYKIAAKYSRIDDVYYKNIQSGEKLVQKESFGELFIIKYDLNNIKWKLINKTKTIKNYECFMATTTKIVKNSKGVFEKPVIAWYSPDIPLNYGPKGYGGLPGLILELHEDKLMYYVTKIKLNPIGTIEIIKPEKGKTLTENEFELKIKEMSSGFWRD
ncbi:GLPGLI family protein [Lutibacter sp. A80]|uniref:GLPGLI family protein n=1 Tax=Lutibacter sp. A80 TaxID=2918453 RepID=UPI001F0562D4|nr:GLPGLI family protein [Lutibacter sp. A80]UMB60587.1 GLPGLI family protein [Lutibacter sp. A80]